MKERWGVERGGEKGAEGVGFRTRRGGRGGYADELFPKEIKTINKTERAS